MVLCWRCITLLLSLELAQFGQQGHAWLPPPRVYSTTESARTPSPARSIVRPPCASKHHGSSHFQSANCTFIIGTAKELAWNLPDGVAPFGAFPP